MNVSLFSDTTGLASSLTRNDQYSNAFGLAMIVIFCFFATPPRLQRTAGDTLRHRCWGCPKKKIKTLHKKQRSQSPTMLNGALIKGKVQLFKGMLSNGTDPDRNQKHLINIRKSFINEEQINSEPYTDNLINKLPNTPLNDNKQLSETELWSSYFDPTLSYMISDPERLIRLCS
ncbi:hypothetical protein BDC45DRAFT_553578 [Circinella umbellata]|nr:hypothetical protein BDC45DRAFT_553577 [Circinella umbellata]KAI7859169.1 hypothetical protein BDC45DRAFT_553578 [Circinella umbellata]